VSRRQLPERNDTGASLIFVLAFVTGVGLIVSALLTFSGTALGGVKSTKYRNDVSYDVDAALKTGITQIRNSNFTNATSGAAECNGFLNDPATGKGATNALTVSGANLGRSVAVTCQGGPSTGVDGGNDRINDQNRPKYSLLTLDNTVSGFQLTDNKSMFSIDGSAFINGPINVNPGSIVVHGDFSAFGGASCPDVKSDTTPICLPKAHEGDPGLTQPVSTADFTYRTPTCPTDGSKTVALAPGFYNDVAALNALTQTGCSTAHTVWLQPGGTYVFDFKTAGSHVWNIADPAVRVIGGKPKGWTSATGYTDAATAAAGGCVAPQDSVNNGGVTLVFGGDSSVNVSAGRFEVCAPYNAVAPPVALYGATSSVAATQTNPESLLAGTALPTTPRKTTSYNIKTAGDLDLVRTDDTTDASAVSAKVTSKVPAAVVFPNFGNGLAIPAGATVTSAKLTVNHKEQSGTPADVPDPTVTVTTTSPAGTTVVATPTAGPSGLAKNTGAYVDQTATLGQPFLDAVNAGGLQSLDVRYDAPVSANADYTSYLQYLKLEITWVGPGLTAQPAAGPTVLTGPSSGGAILIAGTTYVPRSIVAVDLKQGGRINLGWGLIARQVSMKTYGNTNQPPDMPIFSMPKEVHGPDVYFTAYYYECPGNALTCSSPSYPGSGWVRAATARVTFESKNPDMTQPENRQVLVRSWTVRR